MNYSKTKLQNDNNHIVLEKKKTSTNVSESGLGCKKNKITFIEEDAYLKINSIVRTATSSSTSCAILQSKGDQEVITEDKFTRISAMIYNAYQNLSPAVNEVIRNAFIHAGNRSKCNTSLYSITREQYEGALKASKLIQEINKELLKDDKRHSNFLKWKIRCFPSPDFIVNSFSWKITLSSNTKIYIEKDVVDQLVDLHKLLHKAIEEIYTVLKEKQENVKSFKNKPKSSKTQNQISSKSNCSEELCRLQNEYTNLSSTLLVLKGILRETFGSVDDFRNLNKPKKSFKKSKSTNSIAGPDVCRKTTDVSGARRCILDCLSELAEVRNYIKNTGFAEDIDMIKHIELSTQSKKCCNQNDVPHFHAKLNGIPIVLRLSQEAITKLLSFIELNSSDNKIDKANTSLENIDQRTKNAANIINFHQILDADLQSNNTKEDQFQEVKEQPSLIDIHDNKLEKSLSFCDYINSCLSSKIDLINNISVKTAKINKYTINTTCNCNMPSDINTNKSTSVKNSKSCSEITQQEKITPRKQSLIKEEKTLNAVESVKTSNDLQKNLNLSTNETIKFKPIGCSKKHFHGKLFQNFTSSLSRINEIETNSKESVSAVINIKESKAELTSLRKLNVSIDDFRSTSSTTSIQQCSARDNSQANMTRTSSDSLVQNMIDTNSQKNSQRIYHYDNQIRKQLEILGLHSLLHISYPAMCCKKYKRNKKNRSALHYPVSISSLPLDANDIKFIKKRIQEHTRNNYEINRAASLNQNQDLPPEGTDQESKKVAQGNELLKPHAVCFGNKTPKSSKKLRPWGPQIFEVRMMEEPSRYQDSSARERRRHSEDGVENEPVVRQVFPGNELLEGQQRSSLLKNNMTTSSQNRTFTNIDSTVTMLHMAPFDLNSESSNTPITSDKHRKIQEASVSNCSPQNKRRSIQASGICGSQKKVKTVGLDPIDIPLQQTTDGSFDPKQEINRYRQFLLVLLQLFETPSSVDYESPQKGSKAHVDTATSYHKLPTSISTDENINKINKTGSEKLKPNKLRDGTRVFTPVLGLERYSRKHELKRTCEKAESPTTDYCMSQGIESNKKSYISGDNKHHHHNITSDLEYNNMHPTTLLYRKNQSYIKDYNPTSHISKNHKMESYHKKLYFPKKDTYCDHNQTYMQYNFIEETNPFLYDKDEFETILSPDYKLPCESNGDRTATKTFLLNASRSKRKRRHQDSRTVFHVLADGRETDCNLYTNENMCDYHRSRLKHRCVEDLEKDYKQRSDCSRKERHHVKPSDNPKKYHTLPRQKDKLENKINNKQFLVPILTNVLEKYKQHSDVVHQIAEFMKPIKKHNPEFDIKITQLNNGNASNNNKQAKLESQETPKTTNNEVKIIKCDQSTQWPPVIYRNKTIFSKQVPFILTETRSLPKTSARTPKKNSRNFRTQVNQQLQTITERETQTNIKVCEQNDRSTETESTIKRLDGFQQTVIKRPNLVACTTSTLTNIKSILNLKESSKSLDRASVCQNIDVIIKDAVESILGPI